MPRRARCRPPEGTFHVIRRGHNRANCFFNDGDRAHYLSLLARFAAETGTAIHAFVLMSNHVHLLLTAGRAGGVSRLMYDVGSRYSKAINRKTVRTGTLWEDRFRALEVRSDAYVLACYRYIELNPVRAGIVNDPADYRWSSHSSNIGIEPSSWLARHPTFTSLGAATGNAARCYRDLFHEPVSDIVIANLRTIGEPPDPGRTQGPRG